MTGDHPICYIIAGPNGAGKTTFALRYLPEVARCQNFVNADMIAAGLSPLSPEREGIAAARLFLSEIDRFVSKRESFGFETTLSGTTYLRLIDTLRKTGWRVVLSIFSFHRCIGRFSVFRNGWSMAAMRLRKAIFGGVFREA